MVVPYVQTAESYFYTLIVGVVILLVGLAAGFLAKKLLLKLFKGAELNRTISKLGINTNFEGWGSSLVSYVIYLFALILFLDQLGIRSIVLYLFVGAVLILFILTFLVGMRDMIPNFIGWLYLQKQGRIREGHKVEVREIAGIVERVGYLETEIKTDKGDLLYVPNSLFMRDKHKIKN